MQTLPDTQCQLDNSQPNMQCSVLATRTGVSVLGLLNIWPVTENSDRYSAHVLATRTAKYAWQRKSVSKWKDAKTYKTKPGAHDLDISYRATRRPAGQHRPTAQQTRKATAGALPHPARRAKDFSGSDGSIMPSKSDARSREMDFCRSRTCASFLQTPQAPGFLPECFVLDVKMLLMAMH